MNVLPDLFTMHCSRDRQHKETQEFSGNGINSSHLVPYHNEFISQNVNRSLQEATSLK